MGPAKGGEIAVCTAEGVSLGGNCGELARSRYWQCVMRRAYPSVEFTGGQLCVGIAVGNAEGVSLGGIYGGLALSR